MTLSLRNNSELIEALDTKVNSKYEKPSSGIPKGDLANGVQTSLNNADSIPELNTKVDTHLSDYVSHTGYSVTTGTANTYVATLTPALASYKEGVSVRVKINVANTGASTININNLGAKTIKKQNGNALTSGTLKVGLVYTLVYDGTSFILQGEGGEYGTAVASDVLTGKTIGTENGLVTGTLDINPVHGKQEYKTPGTYTFTVPSKVTSIQYLVVGAGGGGGGGGNPDSQNQGGGAGGGGGGAWNIGVLAVTPGQTIAVVVGKGGTGGEPGIRSTDAEGNGKSGTNGTKSSLGSIEAPNGTGGYGGRNGSNETGGYGGVIAEGYGGTGGRGETGRNSVGGVGGGIVGFGQGGDGGGYLSEGKNGKDGAVILIW